MEPTKANPFCSMHDDALLAVLDKLHDYQLKPVALVNKRLNRLVAISHFNHVFRPLSHFYQRLQGRSTYHDSTVYPASNMTTVIILINALKEAVFKFFVDSFQSDSLELIDSWSDSVPVILNQLVTYYELSSYHSGFEIVPEKRKLKKINFLIEGNHFDIIEQERLFSGMLFNRCTMGFIQKVVSGYAHAGLINQACSFIRSPDMQGKYLYLFSIIEALVLRCRYTEAFEWTKKIEHPEKKSQTFVRTALYLSEQAATKWAFLFFQELEESDLKVMTLRKIISNLAKRKLLDEVDPFINCICSPKDRIQLKVKTDLERLRLLLCSKDKDVNNRQLLSDVFKCHLAREDHILLDELVKCFEGADSSLVLDFFDFAANTLEKQRLLHCLIEKVIPIDLSFATELVEKERDQFFKKKYFTLIAKQSTKWVPKKEQDHHLSC